MSEFMKKKMLITGVSGLLGNNLAYYLKDHYDILGLCNLHMVTIEGVDTKNIDLLSKTAFLKCVEKFCPDVIVHCASLTNVDFCETNKELTERVNIDGTRIVVEALRGSKAKLVYISTDSVYDGDKGNFSENDPVNPLNYYGKSKYEGELASLKHNNTLIFRTNIFGWNIQKKDSLAEWILRELINKKAIQCFVDVHFSSIYTFEFANILVSALLKDLRGIYNCGSSSSLTKYEFAVKIAESFGLDKFLIKPISIDISHLKAVRGKNLSLNVDKLSNELVNGLPSVDECINRFRQDFNGGLPSRIRHEFIPYGRQSIDEDDVKAVIEVLHSSNLTQGPKVANFESALREVAGANYVVAVNSGTSALHIACLAAGVGPGDEVITSPNTFVASANCVVYCGATPVFSDIDPRTYNISPTEIERKITGKTRAIIPVHFAGQSCDMEAIKCIRDSEEKKYGHKIFIIEDACHALGSLYKGKKVGSGVFSDMTVLSFHPVKHITTGEGGAVLTNDEFLYKRLRRLRSHGITSSKDEFMSRDNETLAKDGAPWLYEQIELGYNYRITDIQCALGISQLRKLPDFTKRRTELVELYNSLFSGLNFVTTQYESPLCRTNFHLYVLLVDFNKTSKNRIQLMLGLRDKGIQTQVHYIPVHTQPYFQEKFGYKWGEYPVAEDYYKKCLSIPLFPSMSNGEARTVADLVCRLLD